MCRWMGYSGGPIYLDELLLKPEHSLIEQSLASVEGAETTNGDGFGVGWYGTRSVPGLYKDVQPAWNDRNLADLATHIQSPLFLAHVRATTGTPVQRTNCHPFRHGQWLFVHNGVIRGYERVKRDLVLSVDPALYPDIAGTTDSEIMFHLALTYGLEKDPLASLERMAGRVEEAGRDHEVEYPLQMTLGVSDGKRLYAVRYSSEGQSRTLYHSKSMEALQKIIPELAERFSRDARAIVSEPLDMGMAEAYHLWEEIPESSAVILETGEVTVHPFEPQVPA